MGCTPLLWVSCTFRFVRLSPSLWANFYGYLLNFTANLSPMEIVIFVRGTESKRRGIGIIGTPVYVFSSTTRQWSGRCLFSIVQWLPFVFPFLFGGCPTKNSVQAQKRTRSHSSFFSRVTELSQGAVPHRPLEFLRGFCLFPPGGHLATSAPTCVDTFVAFAGGCLPILSAAHQLGSTRGPRWKLD